MRYSHWTSVAGLATTQPKLTAPAALIARGLESTTRKGGTETGTTTTGAGGAGVAIDETGLVKDRTGTGITTASGTESGAETVIATAAATGTGLKVATAIATARGTGNATATATRGTAGTAAESGATKARMAMTDVTLMKEPKGSGLMKDSFPGP
ncbi:hypothetical protein PYCCODRAFT_241232 [Trametes coccinea BRFM310]|uniref:Uncharacterized protein n=1 Tax=Trametes coccinea (strain BRFM310) TaxID=1353009 RepID=A0A1Y2IPT9_TRAC3|nr:hypothetical protein PYCCODRAFT_241232 [Trametes coccinea BRFM310]